jgi:hypothetical protein
MDSNENDPILSDEFQDVLFALQAIIEATSTIHSSCLKYLEMKTICLFQVELNSVVNQRNLEDAFLFVLRNCIDNPLYQSMHRQEPKLLE